MINFRIFVLLLLVPAFYFSSTGSSNNKIDILIKLSDDNSYKDPIKSFIYSKRACILADKSGTSRQKSEAYYYMARNLIFVGRYIESYEFIKKGRKEQAAKDDYFLAALFTELTSNYYSRLHMLPQETRENQKALKLVDPNKNAESKLFVSRIYMWISDCYTEKNKYDSAHIYIDKSIQLIEEIPEDQYLSFNRVFRRKAYSYYYKAQIYLTQQNAKLALPFIDKAYNQSISEQNSFMYPILEAYGDYYFLSKEYQTAISYYIKAIDNKKKYLFACADINLKISQCYKAIGDATNEKKYLKISLEQRRYDEKMSRKHITEVAENILNEEIENRKTDRDKNIFIFSSAIVLSLFVVYRIKKKKNKIIENKNDLLQQNTNDLLAKEKVITILQEKVDDSIPELVQMVKTNSPEFWSRFQTVFPDFTRKMLKLNPNFKTSELTLSAYLYLDFTTKEISQYTFKSAKTIENNRHNLRKKINIASEESLSIWIKEYIKNTKID
ncbi:tetratricopeptide repeat protein [Chryseobacterium sp. M5A1_1a]